MQLQAAPTNPSTVRRDRRSEIAMREGRRARRAKPGARCAAASRRRSSASEQREERPAAPLVTITVNAGQRRKAERAANALATEVIDAHVGAVRRQKIKAFNDQLASIQDQLNTSSRGSPQLERPCRSPRWRADKLVLVQLTRQRAGTERQAARAPVERPASSSAGGEGREAQVVEPAAARQDDGPQPPQHASSAALIGLILGAPPRSSADPLPRAPRPHAP